MTECESCKNYEPKEEMPKSGTWKIDGRVIRLYDEGCGYIGQVVKKDCTSVQLDVFLESLK